MGQGEWTIFQGRATIKMILASLLKIGSSGANSFLLELTLFQKGFDMQERTRGVTKVISVEKMAAKRPIVSNP